MTTESMPATPSISSSGYSRVGAIQLNRPVGSLRGLWRTSGSYLCGWEEGVGGRSTHCQWCGGVAWQRVRQQGPVALVLLLAACGAAW